MTEQYLHGVEVLEIDTGARPIKTVKSSVIGLVGTAPDAVALDFPLNTPVLVSSEKALASLGAAGTLHKAIKGIYDQAGALIVVVRVSKAVAENDTITNIIGGVNENAQRTGLHALIDAKSVLGVQPRILIATGYSHDDAVRAEMNVIAGRLRAIAVIDSENTNDADAITAAGTYGSKRLYLIDPYVKVFSGGDVVVEPASARVAGLIVKIDNEKGFWHSPSNQLIAGIIGTSRPIDFTMGDTNSIANLLNENNVATIINESGYRLWGNRTLSDDPKWAFLSVVRTADMINDSILRGHRWAVDRNITKTYIADVTESVSNYIRRLQSLGAVIGGNCWADSDLNTPANIADGKVFFNFDFTPPYPAEHIIFRSILTNGYLEEII